ncbi:MAG: hypothetical protein DMF89_21410 [Acidobacteria bacterium]|nr:MAG: hypothetical protein DMF89_21410 [Acidobacteriota bacterium]
MRWFEWWKRKPTIEALVWSVRRAVYSDARFRDFEAPRIGIAADAGSGQIILTGAVSTPETRNLTERAARRADGVVTFRKSCEQMLI